MKKYINIKNILRDRLILGMTKRNLKNKDMATICDVTPQAISAWRNTGKIDIEHLPKIAEALDCTVDSLLGCEPAHHVNDNAASYDTPKLTILPIIERDDLHSINDKTIEPKKYIRIDNQHSPKFGNDDYATYIDDDSMSPKYSKGDLILVSRTANPRPRDIVIASIGNITVVGQYRPLSHTDTHPFEIVHTDPFLPTTSITSKSEGTILGTIIEHRGIIREI